MKHKQKRSGRSRISRAGILLPVSALLSLGVSLYLLFPHGKARAAEDGSPEGASLQTVLSRVNGGAKFRPSTLADVVAKAEAFKAMLSTEQLQTLELAYTPALARRWSNLPCANTCRNGIELGTLSAEQLAAALEVIRAAAGTKANEGSDEFNQIRMADTLLAAAQGTGGAGGPVGGGGFKYGEGYYYLVFLNAPSTTDPWMLQYGGHHYGANIAFNQGHVVGVTPLFEALEPTNFDVQGRTYAPLKEERDAMATLLGSLSESQLAEAKLNVTFGDTTMSPGESNGGNGAFPATKVGVAVSSLSQAQKRLVFEAMKPWVQDMDDAVAAKLLSIYQNELDGTYVAFTGNGVAGDVSSFLVSNTNYARIDGPSVWIEFVCQSGVVFRNQIHYHTVWRDHLRDYGKDLSLTVPLDSTADGSVTPGSAANYVAASLAPAGMGLLRGKGMAAAEAIASADAELPANLGDVEVQILDSGGVTYSAPLHYVSPEQITFQTPPAASPGAVSIKVLQGGTVVGEGSAVVEAVLPGLFSANPEGLATLSGFAVRRKADGSESQEPAMAWNPDSNQYEAVALDFGEGDDQLLLVLNGSGFRNASSPANVTATIDGEAAPVESIAAQDSPAGLDQARISIPRSLAGRGEVTVVLTVDGRKANPVIVRIK